jgi:hypothetical protein
MNDRQIKIVRAVRDQLDRVVRETEALARGVSVGLPDAELVKLTNDAERAARLLVSDIALLVPMFETAV